MNMQLKAEGKVSQRSPRDTRMEFREGPIPEVQGDASSAASSSSKASRGGA